MHCYVQLRRERRMSMVLEADSALDVPAIPAADEGLDTADVLEEIIAAHRAALRALAPHQAERSVRLDTAWHIAELGLLLRVRDGGADTWAQKAAPGAVQGWERLSENTGTDRGTH